jgi:hypothetical protein
MNWFRENRFFGTFLVLLGICTLGALWFLWSAKSDWDEASSRFQKTAAELSRLERLSPYPNGENLRKMKAHAENYASALARLKDELKMRVTPVAPMAPNEFQSHLRVAVSAIAEKARASKVKLPDKFYLGFDEFAAGLPNEAAAPLLGQELVQIEWLLNNLLDAHVEALTSFRRTPLPEEHGNTLASTTPATGVKPAETLPSDAKLLERNVVEAMFVSTPGAARKVINQIAGANQQFCIIRFLHVRNQKEKGPPREVAAETAAVVPPTPSPVPGGSPGVKPTAGPPLNFIVGNERIETTVKIEIVRFTF